MCGPKVIKYGRPDDDRGKRLTLLLGKYDTYKNPVFNLNQINALYDHNKKDTRTSNTNNLLYALKHLRIKPNVQVRQNMPRQEREDLYKTSVDLCVTQKTPSDCLKVWCMPSWKNNKPTCVKRS